jgi:hypothetical protein
VTRTLAEIVVDLEEALARARQEAERYDTALRHLRPLVAQTPHHVDDDPTPVPARRVGPAPKRQKGKARPRRQFTAAEKRRVADIARRVGVAAASKQSDVVESVVRRWTREYPAAAPTAVDPLAPPSTRTPLRCDRCGRDDFGTPGQLGGHKAHCGKKTPAPVLPASFSPARTPGWQDTTTAAPPDLEAAAAALADRTFQCTTCKPAQTFTSEAILDGHRSRVHPTQPARAGLVDTGMPRPHCEVEDARRQAYEDVAS